MMDQTRIRKLSSNSSDDTEAHISYLTRIKDIFGSPNRYLERRQKRLDEQRELIYSALPHNTKEQLTITKSSLKPNEISKSGLYESTENTKRHERNYIAESKFPRVHNERDTDYGQSFRQEPKSNGYYNHNLGRYSKCMYEDETRNTCTENPFAIETDTSDSESLSITDMDTDQTFINNGYSGVDCTHSRNTDLQSTMDDRQHASIRNSRNDAPKQCNDIKNWFILLAVINIILVIFVFMLFMGDRQHNHDFTNEHVKQIVKEYLSSSEGKESISGSIYCVLCENIDVKFSNHFLMTDEGRCCLKDASQVLKMVSEMNDVEINEYTSRLKILERDQTRVLSDIVDLQMKVFDKHDIVKGWPKHPVIQKNNRLINVLLTKHRSAIQLKGAVNNGLLKWSTDMSAGKLSHVENVINLEDGGMYVMYSMVRFRKNACGSDGQIGYAIKHRSNTGPALSIASVYKDCSNSTGLAHDLFIQKSFSLSVGQNNDIFIDIGDHENMIDEDSEHYFGVFEL